MKPFLRLEAKLNEILSLLKGNIALTNTHKDTTENLKINKEVETFISLGGSCRPGHVMLVPHRKFSLPLDSFGSPSLKHVLDVIEQVHNGCFDYDSFFEPSLKIKNSNAWEPHWSMVHWIPDFKTIKSGNYDKNANIETFKRRFERLMSLREEPQNFVYLSYRDQNKIKNLSEVLDQVERLSLIFKIKQFIYISTTSLRNDVTGIYVTHHNDDLKNFKEENPYLNETSVKWKNKGIPKYFKYYYTPGSEDNMLLQLKGLNFYEETGIIEQTQRINDYIKTLKII